jgi:hypothetical protein
MMTGRITTHTQHQHRQTSHHREAFALGHAGVHENQALANASGQREIINQRLSMGSDSGRAGM